MHHTSYKSKKTNINDMFPNFKPTNSLQITLAESFKQFDFTLELIAPNHKTFDSVVQSKIDTLSGKNSALQIVPVINSFIQELDFHLKNLQKTIDFIQKDNMKNRSFIIQNKLEQISIINMNKNYLNSFISTHSA